MTTIANQRLRSLSGGAVFADLEQARRRVAARGISIINLGVGSPDQPPSPEIKQVLAESVLRDDVYGYAIMAEPALLEAIAYFYRQRFGVQLDPSSQIVDLLGSQEGLGHVFLGLVEPGDVVLIPDPTYPIYRAGPVLAGAEVYPLPLTAGNNYLPDLNSVPASILNRAKAVVLNYPANPTTAVADASFFAEVVNWAEKWGIWVLHDAAYSDLGFDGYRPPSFLETPGALEVGIEFNSMSKTFNMAGCRIGFAVGAAPLIAVLREVKSHLDYGTFIPIQRAAAFALRQVPTGGPAAAAVYQARRDVLIEAFAHIGWEIPSPKATMFCWAPLPAGHHDDREFVLTLLERAGVIVTPGSGFGPGGRGYVRIALVQDEDVIREAAQRIAAAGIL